jgi:hypothetical protein
MDCTRRAPLASGFGGAFAVSRAELSRERRRVKECDWKGIVRTLANAITGSTCRTASRPGTIAAASLARDGEPWNKNITGGLESGFR